MCSKKILAESLQSEKNEQWINTFSSKNLTHLFQRGFHWSKNVRESSFSHGINLFSCISFNIIHVLKSLPLNEVQMLNNFTSKTFRSKSIETCFILFILFWIGTDSSRESLDILTAVQYVSYFKLNIKFFCSFLLFIERLHFIYHMKIYEIHN